MKPLTAIAIILLINHLGFAALVGWLMGTGRLDRQRLQSVRATFEKTIVQEQQENLQAKLLDEQQRKQQQEKQHLSQVATGPMSIVRRISLEQQAEQLLLEKTERAVQDLASIRNRLDQEWRDLAKRTEELKQREQAFEQRLSQRAESLKDQDFQQAVKMYEQLKPKNVKSMFQELIRSNQQSQVVEYLAAMQLRKAAAVLKEFKTPTEVVQATALVEGLRQRGIKLLVSSALTGANAK